MVSVSEGHKNTEIQLVENQHIISDFKNVVILIYY